MEGWQWPFPMEVSILEWRQAMDNTCELNITEVDGCGSDQSLNSNASLPNVQSTACYTERSVASWAVSFERLLQDPVGVKYFTEFLKKEFSAENILFWQACERFQQIPADDLDQLSKIAREIYNTYLSSNSLSPINIDRQAHLEKDVLNDPTSDMFKAQQLQIFNLMKFDSYTRFVKSSLYQQCVLAEVECQPLPGNNSQERSPALEHRYAKESMGPFDSKKKKKLKSGKSFNGIAQDSYDRKGRNLEKQIRRSKSKLNQKNEKRDSFGGDFVESNGFSLSRRESQGSVYSTASVELGFLSSLQARTESERPSPEIEKEKKVRYCCVYLPDKTASLAMIRPGLTIRELLANVCERHGIPLAATSVYLAGSEKKPLLLDQDSMILCDQEVRVEKKILFELELVPVERKLWVTAKPGKTVSEALQPFLIKYNLNAKEVEAKISGESQPLKLDVTVSCLENQRVILDHKPELRRQEEIKSPSRLSPCLQQKQQQSPTHIKETLEIPSHSLQNSRRNRVKGKYEERKELYRKTYDVEALFEMLSKAQSCRSDDQRGLLKKEDLVLPDFLQLPEKLAGISLQPAESDTRREKGTRNLTCPKSGNISGVPKEEPVPNISTTQSTRQEDLTEKYLCRRTAF
ncbi:regulator of G-protein signaling 14-like isoform X2 [Scyliorhinus canicula]|uniref:regulator of G-protein signaling 14-like isoform X2 n=1 Tax=Scyliorhinus canicula TaxID=7830 RepID=UPI0018F56C5B|nr:regulator of G-protein signaling 14-like isoform X2 [Scyliorhinus canicula]